jgi:hypothetical protein
MNRKLFYEQVLQKNKIYKIQHSQTFAADLCRYQSI